MTPPQEREFGLPVDQAIAIRDCQYLIEIAIFPSGKLRRPGEKAKSNQEVLAR
jgi:hypothetical protein